MQAIDTISTVLMLGSLSCVRDIHMQSGGEKYTHTNSGGDTPTNTPYIHTYTLPNTHPAYTQIPHTYIPYTPPTPTPTPTPTDTFRTYSHLIHGFLERLSEIFDHALETAFEQIRQQRPGHVDTLVFVWRVSVWGFRV